MTAAALEGPQPRSGSEDPVVGVCQFCGHEKTAHRLLVSLARGTHTYCGLCGCFCESARYHGETRVQP